MRDIPKVFISYARQDGEIFATALRKKLEESHPEITLWQDRAQLEGGVGWWHQITTALDNVEFLILVMTPAAMNSPIVRKEWRYARERGVCIYPVKGVPDSGLRYGSVPMWMSKAHFFDLEREWDTFVHHLQSPCNALRVPFMAPDLPEGFVARPALMEAVLVQLLNAARENPIAITTALRGAGGLGKTTLATALCHRDEVVTAFDDGILWVTLGQKPNLQEATAKLFVALTGDRPGFLDEEDAAFHLANILQDKNCLVVIDDVWDVAHLRPFMRGGKDCTRLITTRIFEVAAEAHRVEVNQMTTTESVAMLTARLPTLTFDFERMNALAHRLGEWPLLLELASATLRHRVARGDSAHGALQYLNRKLDEQGVVAFDQRNATSRHQALTRTIDLSLNELDALERNRYCQLAIFPEDTNIPLTMAAHLWDCDSFLAEEIIQRLDDLSLVKFSLENASFQLHDVMRSYAASNLSDAAALHNKLVAAWGDLYQLTDPYAWRNLAYHLAEGGSRDRIRALLLDLNWLQAKLVATDVAGLMSDFEFCKNDAVFGPLSGAIRLAAHVLARDKTQFPSQLLGRLPEGISPEIERLRGQGRRWRGATWLRPLEPSLTTPGGPLLFTLTGHTGAVRTIALTPDGRRAVSGADDLTVGIWDLELGTQIHSCKGHTDWIRAVVVSPDGRWVISTGDDCTVHIWNIETGLLVKRFDAVAGWPRALAITPDGKHILIGGDNYCIQVLATESGKKVFSLKGHKGTVNAITVTSDGTYAISAADDRSLRVWSLETGAELHVLRGHGAKVVGLATTIEGQSVISGSRDDTLRAWPLLSQHATEPVSGRVIAHDAYWLRAITLTPDGCQVIGGADDCSIKVWEVETGKQTRLFQGHADWINGLAVTADARRVVSASDDQTIKIWDLSSAIRRSEPKGHKERVRALVSTADGSLAVSTSDDHKMKIWNLKDRSEILVCRGRSHWPVAVSPDNQFIVSAAGDATLEILNFNTGAVERILSGHTDRVRAVIVTAYGRRIVSASDDRSIRIWDTKTGITKCVIKTERHWTRTLAAAVDGKIIVSGSDDRTLKVWDAEQGIELRRLQRHDARINSVAMSLDNRIVVSASDDQLLKVWDLDTGGEVCALSGHQAKVNALALDRQGQYIVSASDDFTLRVWSLTIRRLLATYTGDSPMHACAVGDGGTIIAGDQTGRLHFLRLEFPANSE